MNSGTTGGYAQGVRTRKVEVFLSSLDNKVEIHVTREATGMAKQVYVLDQGVTQLLEISAALMDAALRISQRERHERLTKFIGE